MLLQVDLRGNSDIESYMPMTDGTPDSELELARFELEKEVKLKELSLKDRELELRTNSETQTRYSAGFVAVIAAVGPLLSAGLVAWVTGAFDINKTRLTSDSAEKVANLQADGALTLEQFKLEKDLIVSAITTGDQRVSSENLRFFAEIGLLPSFKDDVLAYIDQAGEDAVGIPALRATQIGRSSFLVDPLYNIRPGYSDAFLGVPDLSTSVTELQARGLGSVKMLPYYNFTIGFSNTRKMALFAMANVDLAPSAQQPEPGKSYSRSSLMCAGRECPSHAREFWHQDFRVDADSQLSESILADDKGFFDKGHLIARRYVTWGDSWRDIVLANADAYHATNMTPQVRGFNRSNLGGSWGKLESRVFGRVEGKAVVFAGLFADPTDPVNPTGTRGNYQVPDRFWKVVALRSGGRLHAFGFVAHQGLKDTPELTVTKPFDTGLWKVSLEIVSRRRSDS